VLCYTHPTVVRINSFQLQDELFPKRDFKNLIERFVFITMYNGYYYNNGFNEKRSIVLYTIT